MSNLFKEIFADQEYMNLESYKQDGTAVRTPLWFVEVDGMIYFRTVDKSWKVKRILRQAAVRIAPSRFNGALKGEWLDAEAKVLNNDEMQPFMMLLDKKYGWKKWLADRFLMTSSKSGFVVVQVKPL